MHRRSHGSDVGLSHSQHQRISTTLLFRKLLTSQNTDIQIPLYLTMHYFLTTLILLPLIAIPALADLVSDAYALRDIAVVNGDLLYTSLNGTSMMVSSATTTHPTLMLNHSQNTSSIVTQLSIAIQDATGKIPTNTVTKQLLNCRR